MPRKTPLNVRLHAMVSPTMKQQIEGAAERLSRQLGRTVSEARVIRAAIEQTDFAKLALIAAPAPTAEVQRERTTLTPQQAAIIENGTVPFHAYLGGPPGPVKVYPGFPPAEIPDEVKHAFVRWAGDNPIDTDPPKILRDWLEDEIVVEKTDVMTDASAEPIRSDVHYVCQLPEPEWLPCAMHHPHADPKCIYCTTTKITTVLTETAEAKFRPFEPRDTTEYALKIREAQESALSERPE